MANPEVIPATLLPRPPLPSITASALLESRALVSFTRRIVAAWLLRG